MQIVKRRHDGPSSRSRPMESDPHLAPHHNSANTDSTPNEDGNNSNVDNQIYKACEFEHPYPCTKILWSPDRSGNSKDLLATTGDYLRIWNVTDDGSGLGTLLPKKEALLNNVCSSC